MYYNRKKEKFRFSFSSLDLIFLLFLGLLLSLGIYVTSEAKREAMRAPTYQVQASAHYREELLHAVPKAGEELYDEKGNRIGFVEEVEFYEEKGEREFLILFSLYGSDAVEGEEIWIETAFSKGKAKVLKVTEKTTEESI